MTAVRPWASAACLAGRPDDCPGVKDDGRRCANPAHNFYPDDLQPAGVQPTLPDTVADAIQGTDEDAASTHNPDPVEGSQALADGAKAARWRRRRWTCDRCGDLVYRSEHVTGDRSMPVYECSLRDPDPTDDGDPHEWPADLADRLEGDGDPHDALTEAANTVRDFPDIGHVQPYGNNPDSVDLADQVNAAVRAKSYPDANGSGSTIADDVRRTVNQLEVEALDQAFRLHHATRGYRVLIVPERPPELTAGEVKRITAAHMVLRPEQALDVARTIITERLTNPEGVDQ